MELIIQTIRNKKQPRKLVYYNSLYKLERGCSYFAENGNWPIFMAENGNIAYISTDFWHKNSGQNGIIMTICLREVSVL